MSAHEQARIIVLLASFWVFGWLVAALMAYFVIPLWGWRTVMLLCALPALYTIYLRRNLPGSGYFEQVEQIDKSQLLMSKIVALWAPQYKWTTIILWVVWFTVVLPTMACFVVAKRVGDKKFFFA